jgi:coenzyme PQQ biosynthesis protein PqqD
VDGSAVIVLADAGEVTVLNPVGTSVWDLIDGARTVADIVAAIQAEYDVSAAQAEQDVAQFLNTLVEAGALTLADQPAPS